MKTVLFMKPLTLALLAAAGLVPAGAYAQTNTFTDVTVKPDFMSVLAQPSIGISQDFFATPAVTPEPANPQGYGLGIFSFIDASDAKAQFEIDNLTFIFSGGADGPVTLPYDITNDVTLQNLALSETFADGFTQSVLPAGTSLDTGTISFFSDPFAYDPATGDPTHGLLVSATLTGALDQTNLTIAQPNAAPEPGTPGAILAGALLLGALVARRRIAAAA